ncbi:MULTISPECIES: cation:proton antiporter domain-containing protein [Streptomyces]|uniref:Cation/H+ exchanger transmembrane domain-containing protein n=1 Tax=Streptomyces dengpaensis TaxID=2049881 RepID=A0ABN5HU72_9ACTN|nr:MULTISPECIES: cation:proton antiporter [Streptomyces]AVH54685.1 hypothetical protein C4B68_01305 [Streptomyces dengpaensis]PIB05146.1 hypothetical protein B1C81_29885 [Streptomyces sp. HG99]
MARPLIGRLLGLVQRSENSGDLGAATVVGLLVLAATGTHALQMEPILGAFLCGIVIGSAAGTGRRFLSAVRPFIMAVLAPPFLATAGLQANLSALADPSVLMAAVVTLAVAVGAKLAGGYAGARLTDRDTTNRCPSAPD